MCGVDSLAPAWDLVFFIFPTLIFFQFPGTGSTSYTPSNLMFRPLASLVFKRCASSAPQNSPAQGARAAGAIIDAKLNDLAAQLEQEDAYMGPITASQRSSDVQYGSSSHTRPDLDRLRVVPRMMAFYMANPALEEALRTLRALVDKYQDIPTVELTEKIHWVDPNTIYGETKEGLTKEQQQQFYSLLNRLSAIEPQLQPPTLRNLLYEMKDKNSMATSDVGSVAGGQQSVVAAMLRKSLDQLGRSETVGRRKTASAKVYMARSHYPTKPGQIYINNRSIEQFFPSIVQRQEALYPLKVTNTFAKFNIQASVRGGGQTSEAQAVALAIAKGISVQNPLLISRLLEAGCLETDTRQKERKKPGKAKARKSYGWVKR